MSTKYYKDYYDILFSIANEIALMSISAERLREIQTLQEAVTSLTLQLKKRDKEIKDLKQKFKGMYLALKHNYILLFN